MVDSTEHSVQVTEGEQENSTIIEYKKKTSRKYSYKTILLFIVGTGLLIYFLIGVDYTFINFLSFSDLFYFILALSINVLILLFKAIRWKSNLLLMQENISLKNSFQSVSIGFFVGIMTPLSIGDIARIINVDFNKMNGVFSVIFEKIIDIFSLLSLGGLALMLIYYPSYLYLYAIGFIVLLILLIVFYNIVPKFFKKENQRKPIKGLFTNKLAFLKTFLYSYLLWFFPALQLYIITLIFDFKISLLMLLTINFLPIIATFAFLVPLGIGTSEFTARFVLVNIFEIAKSISDGIIILVRIVGTLPLFIYGFLVYNYTILRGNKNEEKE